MRDTIDFGIDLGTTNSALAVVTHGEVSVVKNQQQADYTPSAVWINKRGAVQVGTPARSRMNQRPDEVQVEFKQEMGLNDIARPFANGATRTPEQLSAEVLKSLRADAQSRFAEAPRAAVITVPAAFLSHQTNATSQAAKLAGFDGACPLVQEPTAAAYAFGFQNAADDACFMVFDLGGGTFDSAMVTTRDGELRILDHAGDPHLGGKLIDWEIVERLLAPAAARVLRLPDFTRSNPEWRLNFLRLKTVAEEAKIALSRAEIATVDVDLTMPDGSTENVEVDLHRGEVDQLAEPFYLRAIDLCREALRMANLGPDDVDRLLLVGGPTLAPGLRERLADPTVGLGIALDHSQDPSTVVARGAAVYASTVPLERPATAPKVGEFTADLEYPRTTSLTSVVIGGRVRTGGTVDWSGYQVVLTNPTAAPVFRGTATLGAEGAFVVELLLQKLSTNTFTLELYDALGNRQRCTPDTLTITHWANEPAGTVLADSLGIAEADGVFTPLIDKNTTLPAHGYRKFETTAALRRSDPTTTIRIPIMEGDRRRADRNLEVGVIEIWPKDIRFDLEKGTDVDITIEVDTSRLITVTADVPVLNSQFEAQVDRDSIVAPDADSLWLQLAEVEERLDRLRAQNDTSDSSGASERLKAFDRKGDMEWVRGQIRTAPHDQGSAAAAEQRIREIQATLDDVEEDLKFPELVQQVTAELDSCRDLIGRHGDARDRAELGDIDRKLADARRTRDAAAVEALAKCAFELHFELLRKEGTLDIQIFFALRAMVDRMDSPGQARRLLREGERAVAAERWDALSGVNQRLRRLLPPGVLPSDPTDPMGPGVKSDRDRS